MRLAFGALHPSRDGRFRRASIPAKPSRPKPASDEFVGMVVGEGFLDSAVQEGGGGEATFGSIGGSDVLLGGAGAKQLPPSLGLVERLLFTSISSIYFRQH
jgi:hypothetical protein